MTHRRIRIPMLTVLAVVLALVSTLLLVPRVAGQETRTITFDVVINPDAQALLPGPGHDGVDLARGDVGSGQGAVYAAGDSAGNRLGTFYYRGVLTADAENFQTAANHLYLDAFIEIWGHGSLAVTGTVNFLGTPTYLAVTGGTGEFAMSTGQCTLVSGPFAGSWSCDIQ